MTSRDMQLPCRDYKKAAKQSKLIAKPSHKRACTTGHASYSSSAFNLSRSGTVMNIKLQAICKSNKLPRSFAHTKGIAACCTVRNA